jgi:hypothetical protein
VGVDGAAPPGVWLRVPGDDAASLSAAGERGRRQHTRMLCGRTSAAADSLTGGLTRAHHHAERHHVPNPAERVPAPPHVDPARVRAAAGPAAPRLPELLRAFGRRREHQREPEVGGDEHKRLVVRAQPVGGGAVLQRLAAQRSAAHVLLQKHILALLLPPPPGHRRAHPSALRARGSVPKPQSPLQIHGPNANVVP